MPDALLVDARKALDDVARGDQHSRRAEAALEPMLALKSRAQFVRDLVVFKAFDGPHLLAFAGHGRRQAGAHGDAIEQDRADPQTPCSHPRLCR